MGLITSETLNIVSHKQDLNYWNQYVNLIKKVGNAQHDEKDDALWKWCSIVEIITQIIDGDDDHIYKIIDIGSGGSTLSPVLYSIFKDMVDIAVIDNRAIPRIIQEKAMPIKCYLTDFYEAPIEDGSIDIFMDACSLIHFDINSENHYNDGLLRAGQYMKQKLAPGGYFVMATDILARRNANNQTVRHFRGEFIHIERIVDIMQDAGLTLVGDCDFCDYHEEAFTFEACNRQLQMGRLVFQNV